MPTDDGRFAELAEHSSLFGLAIVVGLIAGAIAVAFQQSLAAVTALREGAVGHAGPDGWGLALAASPRSRLCSTGAATCPGRGFSS